MDNKNIIFILIIILIFSGTGLNGQAVDNQLTALRLIKSVKISVDQSYGEANNVSLPFAEITSRLFQAMGVVIIPPEQELYDLHFIIHARGKAKGTRYSGNRYLFTGASLSGIMKFQTKQQQFEWSFSGHVLPPREQPPQQNYDTPSKAPFHQAFYDEFSFIAKLLGIMEDIYGQKVLMSAMSDPEEGVRMHAARLLRKYVNTDVVTILIETLNDSSCLVLAETARSLSSIGDRQAVIPLMNAITNRTGSVRKYFIDALGDLKDTRSVDLLISILQQEKSPDIQMNAVTALGKIADVRSFETLKKFTTVEDNLLKEKIYWALSQLDDERALHILIQALENRNNSERNAIAEALGNMQKPVAVMALITALRDEDKRVQEKSRESLIRIGDIASEPLLSAFTKADDVEKLHIITALGEINASQSVTLLSGELKNSNPDIRRQAAFALEKIKDPHAVPSLIDALYDDEPTVRVNVINALGEMNDSRSINPLIAATSDHDARVRERAIIALGKINDERAVETLLSLLNDSDWNIIRLAAMTLGELENEKAIDLLVELLSHKDRNIRYNAKQALMKIGTPAIEELIIILGSDNAEAQLSGREILTKIGSPAVEQLTEALKDSDGRLRLNAARVLGEINDDRAVVPLIEALKDNNVEVCINAIAALGSLKDTRAVNPLINLLYDPDHTIRINTISALGEIRSPLAVAPLISMLSAQDDDVRRNTSSALEKIGKPATGPLIEVLTTGDYQARQQAANALGGISDPIAKAPLMTALKDHTPEVRASAAEALGKLDEKDAVEPLIVLLDDEEPIVQKWAAFALGNIGDSRAIMPLIDHLHQKYSGLSPAADALKKITGQYFGLNKEKWLQWWNENKHKYESK